MPFFVQISESDIKKLFPRVQNQQTFIYFLKQDILGIIQLWKYTSHRAAAQEMS